MNYGMDFQGGDGGGGFGSPQNPAGGSSQGGGGGGRRSYDEQTLIPVSLRMALRTKPDVEGGDGGLVLEDGRKLALVKFVGAVRGFQDHSTNVLYEIEDGTGLMEVKQWLDDNDCSALQELRQETLRDHVYVRVVGQVKEYDGKKIVVANSVRRISTGNEITHHFLEVACSAEAFKRADSIVPPAPRPSSASSGVGFGGTSAAGPSGGDPLREAVVRVFEHADPHSEVGVHVSEAVQQLAGAFPEAEVRKAIESLSEEGHVYSTISDDHFKWAN